ncbi:hypothetical protein GDO81_012369 [Engystomops pustulosus]|uniref:Uncharacterized protein n=1 Tax=Engystomops pustulosus TaxID=76066 RepID=A0AAV7BLG3_ENGPU|nr:hypothetical protein GDO81_012369 [Engystomops pustulosus]
MKRTALLELYLSRISCKHWCCPLQVPKERKAKRTDPLPSPFLNPSSTFSLENKIKNKQKELGLCFFVKLLPQIHGLRYVGRRLLENVCDAMESSDLSRHNGTDISQRRIPRW